MATGVAVWSKTAASNASSDSNQNWAEGMAPSAVNDSARALMASVAKWRDDLNGTLTTSGSSTAYTLTSNQTFGALTAGNEIGFCLDEDCGDTVTINVDSLGSKPLRPSPGVELGAGELKAGVPYRATYFSSNSGEWILHGALVGQPKTTLTSPASDDLLTIGDTSDSGTQKRITLSDTLKVINDLTEDSSPDGTLDFVPTYDASASGAKKVKLNNLPAIMPRGHLWGLTLSNNSTDATNDIDISAGEARDKDNSENIILASAIIKRLDGSWAVGDGEGGLDTGSIANGTYHVWLIKRTDTGVVDALFSTSATSPTMPSNYDKARRIGSILRESNAIVAFVQDGDYFRRKTSILSVQSANPGSSAVNCTLNVPTGLKLQAIVNAGLSKTSGSNGIAAYFSDPETTDQSVAFTNAPAFSHGALVMLDSGGVGHSYAQMIIRTNTSAQIRGRLSFSDGNTTLQVVTLGWYDSRGRLS